MVFCEVIVINATGLHARPAAIIVAEASKFKSCLSIITLDKKTCNMKSIIGIMSLAILVGTKIKIQADGEDEVTALQALQEVMKKNNFI